MSRESEYLVEWSSDDDENDFFVNVRVWSKWDQAHFERMVSTANAFLDEMEESRHVDSDRWDAAFTSSIEDLISLMSHPGFLAENDRGLSRDTYRTFIFEKITILKSIIRRYKALKSHLAPLEHTSDL